MFCRKCHGTREWCEHCGGSGLEPKHTRALTQEEQIKDYWKNANGNLQLFLMLVTKRFGRDIIETAMSIWNQRTPQIV